MSVEWSMGVRSLVGLNADDVVTVFIGLVALLLSMVYRAEEVGQNGTLRVCVRTFT